MSDPNAVAGEPLGRSLLVIAEDLESALDLGALAHETYVVAAGTPEALPDELFDSVVVQASGDLDGLLHLARDRTTDSGAILVDSRSGGQVRHGGWRAMDVVGGRGGVSLVQVEPAASDRGEGVNLLLRATRQASESSDPGLDASWMIRSRTLAQPGGRTFTAPQRGAPRSQPGARATPSTQPPTRRRPNRSGWRKALPETLAISGPDFGRRVAVVALTAILWTLLGVLVAGLTGTGWLAVALWVIAGLQLGQLAQSEITRRSLKLLILRSPSRR